jgi:hypothetical protein
VIDEFAALNKQRNGYAHGLWYTGPNGALFLEEETDTYGVFLGKREVKPREVATIIKRMAALAKRIDRHERNLHLAKALLASQQTPPPPTSGNNPGPNQGTT